MEWTKEDELRAAKEGWRFSHGHVQRVFNKYGMSVFTGTQPLVKYLREHGKISEWHRNVYCSLPWSAADANMAYVEGWGISSQGQSISISTYSALKFKTNALAQEFVLEKAQAGDPLHNKALAYIAKYKLINGNS